jgi:20S proteasome alpha/beta subunit
MPLYSPLCPVSPDVSQELAPVSMGTTILAVSYKGGVILGADSRTSTGSYIANRVADKVGLCGYVSFDDWCSLLPDASSHNHADHSPF